MLVALQIAATLYGLFVLRCRELIPAVVDAAHRAFTVLVERGAARGAAVIAGLACFGLAFVPERRAAFWVPEPSGAPGQFVGIVPRNRLGRIVAQEPSPFRVVTVGDRIFPSTRRCVRADHGIRAATPMEYLRCS